MRRVHKYADGGKVVKSETNMDGYDNADDAAAAAQYVISHMPDASDQEYMALVYQDPKTGRYMITDPQNNISDPKRRQGKTSGKFAIPRGSLRSLVHNHPDYGGSRAPEQTRLSEDDINMARKLKVPSYISVGYGLYNWDPAKNNGRNDRGYTTETLAKIPGNLFPPPRPTPEQLAQTPAPPPDKPRGSR